MSASMKIIAGTILLIFGFLTWSAIGAFGQGVVVGPQQALQSGNSGIVSRITFATITVCAANSLQTPCSPALGGVLFKDAGLSQPLSNPFSADINGNYQFAIAPGQYTVTVTASGFSGYSYQLTVTCAQASNCTWTGKQSFTNINNRIMCDQSPGATFDVQVNNCIATVIAAGGGVADATGLTGNQSGTNEIDVGSNITSGITLNHISVTLLLSPYLVYSFTSSTAGACAFKVFDQSRLIGTVHGTTYSAIIANGSASTATGSLVCSNYTQAGNYIAIQGIQLINRPGGANNSNFTNGAMFIKNTIDNSTIRDVVVANGGGIGLQIESTCCATNFYGITIDGGSIAGSKPLVIQSLSGDPASVVGLHFYSLSADHPGTGLNSISIKHTFASILNTCDISIFGLYIESNNTDTASDLINIDSCEAVKIDGFAAQYRAVTGSITGVAIRVSSVSQPAINPNVTVANFTYLNSNQLTCPYNVLAENFGSFAVPSNANCTLPFYSAGDGFLTADQMAAVQQFGVYETGSGGIPALNRDVCRGSSSAHAIQCNYNNTTFFNQTQTIASGTATMTTAAIAAAACGTTVTVAAANVATTDTITWAFNAAPGGQNAGLVAWPTSGNVNFAYCSNTAETPAAATINWRVMR